VSVEIPASMAAIARDPESMVVVVIDGRDNVAVTLARPNAGMLPTDHDTSPVVADEVNDDCVIDTPDASVVSIEAAVSGTSRWL
jgi:hypothetical protein